MSFNTANWKTAPDDLYGNQRKYERLRNDLERYCTPPESDSRRKYWIKNRENLQHFKTLLTKKDAEGVSYVRRIGVAYSLLIFCHVVKKNFKEVTREDVDQAMTFARTRLTPQDQSKWVEDMKHIARIIEPELDQKGRPDDTIVPYSFRHLSSRVDKSRQKRKQILSPDETVSIIQYFSQDPRMQSLISLCYESLARPQELLYLKIKDVELFDNYAKIWVSEHGKEGTKFLECVDTYPVFLKWYNQHPLRSNPEAWLFCNIGDLGRHAQMTTFNVNKHLRKALAKLNIKKTVTFYTFKRAGVTHQRIAGVKDAVIQHKAGWTTTKQLKTYDYSEHEDTFKQELVKRGLVSGDQVPDEYKQLRSENRQCAFCGSNNGLSQSICANCKRPLDRTKIMAEMKQKETQIAEMQEQMNKFNELLTSLVEGKTVALKENEKTVVIGRRK